MIMIIKEGRMAIGIIILIVGFRYSGGLTNELILGKYKLGWA